MDTAQTGIEQMLEEAESENLAVDGVIADITYELWSAWSVQYRSYWQCASYVTEWQNTQYGSLKNPVMQSAKLVLF